MLAPLLAMQGLRVVTRFPDERAMVLADDQRLEQVLIAVLHNAVQISVPGALVRVAVDITEADVRVEVQHTGERLADAAVERVFQRFTRHEGAWLGLPTAQRIVQAHAGRIGVEPGATGGNVFWFTLPRLAQ
jgi:signal transduction histidine kinase